MKILGLKKLKNVLLVKELTVNLISVSQLCEEYQLLQFTKDKCIAYNQNHGRIMEGDKTSDNCYLLTRANPYMHEIQETLIQQFEHTKRSDCTIIGPSSQKHSDMKATPDQMSSLCMERSLPSCTNSQLSIVTRLLELLYIDLMGSRVEESIERKRFIYAQAIRTVCLYL